MKFNNQTNHYKGKVRDVFSIGSQNLVMVASNRISAFDHILPREIPYKGHILNLIATEFLKQTATIVPNWLVDAPLPNVSIGKRCEPIALEMVIRGYLTGHAWRIYKKGERVLCGVTLPEGMKEHDKFPEPIITPAIKATEGHDEDISREDILVQKIVDEATLNQLENYTRSLFKQGTKWAQERGLILVDTKYEFGMFEGSIMLMDEIHTPDSSRYFYADTYEENQKKGSPQKQLSKEFVREWLIENGFQGLDGQKMPSMNDAIVENIMNRYIELYEKLLGKKFEKIEVSTSQIEQVVNAHFETKSA
jgi:phosphoribosylaminoimidazole-succinocarboxamide synthase